MKISYNWLKQYVDLPKKVTPEVLANDFTLATAEVEGIESVAEKLENVVAGRILEISDHPDAEKLRVAKVDLGFDQAAICFGKQLHLEKNWIVPVAVPGAVLPGDIKIEARNMRGIESQGMICVDEELGFDAVEENALTVFPDGTKLGEPIVKLLDLDDQVIEIDNKSLTHRPDLWGHFGLAREAAAIYGAKLKHPVPDPDSVISDTEILGHKIEKSEEFSELSAKISAKNACSRYMALRIEGIEVTESPKEIKSRLLACGLPTINNIVDATNFVMYELGQPLHAFDAANVDDQAIDVRFAESGEMMKTLDGSDHELSQEDLVIADAKGVIGIAGVKGGEDSKITENTTAIILESAVFDPVYIRKTAARHALPSDASQRYEKTLDPEGSPASMLRVAQIILDQFPDAKITSELVDVKNFKKSDVTISIDGVFLAHRLGFKLEKARAIEILESLEFGVTSTGNSLHVAVPSFRATKDISIREDLVEEIARIYGYDNFPSELPRIQLESRAENLERVHEREYKRVLRDLGWNEVYNRSFLNANDIKRTGLNPGDHLQLKNPAAEGEEYMRTSLLTGLLNNTKLNLANFDEFKIFELDRVFKKQPGAYEIAPDSQEMLPAQPYELTGVYFSKSDDSPFFEVKGVVESLFQSEMLEPEIQPTDADIVWAQKGSVAKVLVGGQPVGIIADVSEKVLKNFKIKGRVACFVLNFDTVASLDRVVPQYQAISKFPVVVRDLAVEATEEKPAAEYVKAIMATDSLITDVELFDVYRGKQVGEGKRSLAFRIRYESTKRTLKDKEVDKIQDKIATRLQKDFGAEVRGK